MKNRIIKIFAVGIYLITLPFIPIEIALGYPGHLVSRIKQNFQIIMYAVSIGNFKINC